jgi:hypothetical protein
LLPQSSRPPATTKPASPSVETKNETADGELPECRTPSPSSTPPQVNPNTSLSPDEDDSMSAEKAAEIEQNLRNAKLAFSAFNPTSIKEPNEL